MDLGRHRGRRKATDAPTRSLKELAVAARAADSTWRARHQEAGATAESQDDTQGFLCLSYGGWPTAVSNTYAVCRSYRSLRKVGAG